MRRVARMVVVALVMAGIVGSVSYFWGGTAGERDGTVISSLAYTDAQLNASLSQIDRLEQEHKKLALSSDEKSRLLQGNPLALLKYTKSVVNASLIEAEILFCRRLVRRYQAELELPHAHRLAAEEGLPATRELSWCEQSKLAA